jgi:fused signal recognition particle receptor
MPGLVVWPFVKEDSMRVHSMVPLMAILAQGGGQAPDAGSGSGATYLVLLLVVVGLGAAIFFKTVGGQKKGDSDAPKLGSAEQAKPAEQAPATSLPPLEERPQVDKPVEITGAMTLKEIREAKKVRYTDEYKASGDLSAELERRKGKGAASTEAEPGAGEGAVAQAAEAAAPVDGAALLDEVLGLQGEPEASAPVEASAEPAPVAASAGGEPAGPGGQSGRARGFDAREDEISGALGALGAAAPAAPVPTPLPESVTTTQSGRPGPEPVARPKPAGAFHQAPAGATTSFRAIAAPVPAAAPVVPAAVPAAAPESWSKVEAGDEVPTVDEVGSVLDEIFGGGAPAPSRAQAPAAASPAPPAAAVAQPVDAGAGRSMKEGLEKTRGGFIARLGALFSSKPVLDEALLEQVEEVLFTSDVGVKAGERLMQALHRRVAAGGEDATRVWEALRSEAAAILDASQKPFALPASRPAVLLMVGVNGVGKTTTIGKLAARFQRQGLSVMMVAGDTFRAGAVGQLEEWSKRVGCPIHMGADGIDPASVVFDGIKAGVAAGADVILVDTAGRLQTKVPLMDELRKIGRVCDKAVPGAPHETILVLDANTGQNAVQQARMFGEAVPLSGLVLTKLDGTAKGGAVIGISDELRVPIYFMGIGEAVEDLRPFDVPEFVEALF